MCAIAGVWQQSKACQCLLVQGWRYRCVVCCSYSCIAHWQCDTALQDSMHLAGALVFGQERGCYRPTFRML